MATQSNIVWVLAFLLCISVTIVQTTRPLIVVIGEPSDPDLDISPLIRSIEVANDYQQLSTRESNEYVHNSYLSPAVVFNPHLGTDERSYRQAVKRYCPAVYALIEALNGSQGIIGESYSVANTPEFPFSPFWSVSLSNDPHISTHVPPTPHPSGSLPTSHVNANTLLPHVLPALPHSMVAACASVLYARNIHSPRGILNATNNAVFGDSPAFAPVLLLLHATPAMYTVQPEHALAATADGTATADTDTPEAARMSYRPSSRVPPTVLSADAWAYTVTPPLFDKVLGAHIRRRLLGQTQPQQSEWATEQEDVGVAQAVTDTGAEGSGGSVADAQPWPVHVWGHPEPFPWYGVLPAHATEMDDVADTETSGASAELTSALYHWPMSPAALLHPYRFLRHVWLCACHAVEVEKDARRVLQTPCTRDEISPVVPNGRGQLAMPLSPFNRDGCVVNHGEQCGKAEGDAGAVAGTAFDVCLSGEKYRWLQGEATSLWSLSNERIPTGDACGTPSAGHNCSNDDLSSTNARASSDATRSIASVEPSLCALVDEPQLNHTASLAGDGIVGLSRGEVRLIHQRRVGVSSLATAAHAEGGNAPVYQPLVAALTLLARGVDAAELRRIRDGCGDSHGHSARYEARAESADRDEYCNGLDAMYQQIEEVLQQSRAVGANANASRRAKWDLLEPLLDTATSMDDDEDDDEYGNDDDDEDETFIGGSRDVDDLLSSLRTALG